jgi:tetratricopeptide (TPR) repeat protein
LLREPLPRLVEAKKPSPPAPLPKGEGSSAAAGKAGFEDQVILLLHFQATQQWDRVLGHLDAAETLSGKPGMRWVRTAILRVARKAEDAKKRYFDEAETLAKLPAGGDVMFLSEYLIGQSSSILEANEMLRLLEVLRPVYERQPAHLRAMKGWTERRLNSLQQTGQTQEVLKLRKQLAQDYPHDYSIQQQYARALAGVGEYKAAYAWLDRVLVPESKWLPYEDEYLRTTYADLLREQGRYGNVVEYLGAYIKQNPPSQSIYAQYLAALVWDDQQKQADALMAQWIKDAERPDELPPDVDARLRAAVSQALGQGYNLYANRIDEQWFKPLADAAIYFGVGRTGSPSNPPGTDHHSVLQAQASVAEQIMNQHHFQQSDECRRVRRTAVKMLLDEIDKLPMEQIQRLINWVSANDPAVEKEAWKQIAAGLRRRWDAEPDWQIKGRLGGILASVLQGHIGADEWLSFLRAQLKGAPEEHRAGFARQLFDALLGQPWKQANEDEAFGLLEQISDAEKPSQRLAVQVAALCQMTDRMVQARFQNRMKAVEHPEKLTRPQLRDKREENLRLAREGYADRLQKEMAKHQGRLAQWISAERLYLDVIAGRKLDKVVEECWEFLGAKPRGPLTILERGEVRGTADDDLFERLDNLLQHRYLVTVINLASRKGAKPSTADRVLAYLDTGAKADPEDPSWKAKQHQLLVALDRPKDLAKKLQDWIAGKGDSPRAEKGTVPFSAASDADNRWRLTLGYLEAETGRIAEAIKLFEVVRAADELRGPDLRTLADWYMAVNRRDAYDRARIDAFKVTDEYQLSRWLYAKLRPWQRQSNDQQPPPRELDVEVLFAFTALFEKSSQPQNYLYQLAQFYGATRDFRLLAGLGDAVVGHTAGQVYPFLQNMSSVLAEVRDEATADSIVERIAEARKRAKTSIDQRALDVLELLVDRRAAELQNQPGPHVERALTAMKRAWKREWSSGEPRLMADLLASLGNIAQARLADEQVRELESLHKDAQRGTADRLHIGYALARTYWAYSRHDRAIDLLSAALDEYQAVCGGVLPTTANDPLSTFISYLEGRTHHARAEKVLQEQLKRPANQQQTYWLVQRLYQVYESAIANDGDVSLGRGVELYRAVDKKLQQDLDAPDQNHRYYLVSRLCSIYRTANNKKLPDVAADVRRFAFERFPVVLKRQTNNYTSMVSETANVLHDIAGARDGLAFLIRRIETEPTWFRLNNQDGWSQHSYSLGHWRTEVKDLGELDKPLLKLVTDELRRDLHSRQSRNQSMYRKHSGHFWAEKEAVFARVADEVWAQDKQSGASCLYIAEYLYHGLDHYGRAIEILLDAHRREVLDENGQSRLVQFLHRQKRFAESVPVLEPLVARRPDNLQYRMWLMHAYFKTGQPQRLMALLKQTHDYFHQENRWNENAMAVLGRSCLENELYQQSVDYLQEAIKHHERTAPRRGIGDGTLSGYYGDQARAYAGLKKTPEAVEAASGAVVAWGRHIQNRANALESLKAVLRSAPDLDAYVVHLDTKAAETRQENPVVRKAIGQVYLEKQQYGRAIAQLRLAAEVQPNDIETHQALLTCCDKQQDEQGAVDELLHWREAVPRDVKLYEDLGNRLKKLGQAPEAERAYTSIAEVLPAESESHQLLAEVRQRQDRWPEAVVQWEQVARIRSLEPTGLVGLARALIHQRRWTEAADVVAKLKQKTWPVRFENPPENLRGKLQELEEKVRQGQR